ncbi:hypothetical protein HY411_02470, partial [Candidatus Gottesmanbacteria bacterium]|nr:hypothetical protein [Candidatus Gottesmanbacteria bacterium]
AGLLLSFHKRLKSSCGGFNKISEWYGYLKDHLQPILNEYGDELPPEMLKKIKGAMKLTDESKTGINEACQALQGDIGKVAAGLAGRGFFGSTVLGTFLVGALAVGGLVAYLKFAAVTLTLTNDGCDAMTLSGNIPVNLPGLSVPPDPIRNGQSATLTVPPLRATVDGTSPGGITVTTFGFTLRFAVDPSIRVTLDGESLNGKRTEVNLGNLPTHKAIVSCR